MKDRFMLLIAAVAGVLATALAFLYIDAATSGAQVETPPQTLEVLFAVEDLPANSILDAQSDLRVETVVIDETPGLARSAIKASERSAVHGRPISSPVPAGVPLLYAHLTPIKDVDLSPGMRAMAINVSEENLMGGILVPGDRVDILVSYHDPKAQQPTEGAAPTEGARPEEAVAAMMSAMMSQLGNSSSAVPSQWVTEEVLTNVRIIAIGSSLSGSRQAQLFGLSGGRGRSSTLTLELTTEQARELIRVQASGRNPLTLLLRPEDTSSEAATSTLLGS